MTKKKFQALQKKTASKRKQLEKKLHELQECQKICKTADRDVRKTVANHTSVKKSVSNQLERKRAKAHNRMIAIREEIAIIENDLLTLVDDSVFSINPRDRLHFLNDDIPIFLMPVRIETRFVTVKHIARVKPERIQSNTANPLMTVVDGALVAESRPFTVASIFEDRSEVPVIEDAEELWVRIFPDDIAIHTHENLLTETEYQAATTFWMHMWHAGNDESLQLGAWRGLVGGRGPERAAWIARQTIPLNQEDRPKVITPPLEKLPVEPEFPEHMRKEGSFSQAPHTRVMPDRFIARLYNGSQWREVVGKPIPASVNLGIDPLAEENEITSSDGKLEMNDRIKWVNDFDTAEEMGMAIRVPLTLTEQRRGFDKILVLGVKVSANEEEGQQLLEDLLNNHHYTHGGMALVPQGTPTNNTEDAKSGYTALNSKEEDLFQLELGKPILSTTTNDKKKKDGQRLADALGISYSVFEHSKYADREDINEAMCMNTALWPTTLGYYLRQMMHPIFTDDDINRTRAHFNKYVLGRGRTPAIRIDDQPYGILPTTCFSKWKYSGNDRNSRFLSKVHKNVLTNMEKTWDTLSRKITHATSDTNISNYSEHFLSIMGLHASSVEYYQRFVTGPYFLWNLFNYSNVITNSATTHQDVNYASSLEFLQLFGAHDFLFLLPPRVFDFYYAPKHKYLDGPVVDKLKLSEKRSIRAMGSNGENYIHWLRNSNWNQIKKEDFSNIGASGAVPPNALLYLMLRHSALLEYVRTGVSLLVKEGILHPTSYLDLELINLATANSTNLELENLVRSKVRFEETVKLEKDLEKKVVKKFSSKEKSAQLRDLSFEEILKERNDFRSKLSKEAQPTLEKNISLATEGILKDFSPSTHKLDVINDSYTFLGNVSLTDYIDINLAKPRVDQDLLEIRELHEALDCLKDLPTARLERAFAEHIDLTSYRLDAWFYSLVNERLDRLRKSGRNRNTGIYLGGYAWLEDLRPSGFRGIHYREVDITPDKITVPGFLEVALGDKVLEGTNVTVSPNIPIVAGLSNRSIERFNKMATQLPLSDELSLLPTGGATLDIRDTITEVTVADPNFLDVPKLVASGPKFVYLGTNKVGDITYDFVQDQFIHKPRIDQSNQGFIHAPSINHATTAAVLRAGYHAHGEDNEKLAVNLNSERVRRAMFFLEGIRNGQELGALLGYQLERGLRDHGTGETAQYIFEMRAKYPMVAQRINGSDGSTTISEAEAYNVINGLALVENSEKPGSDFPYGITELSGIPASHRNVIVREVTKLHDALDGVNDLLMSESMYQVVQSNFVRANGALNAMSGKGVIDEAQVIKTPRNFNVLTHKFGIHFDTANSSSQLWTTSGTPRSILEPHLNTWLHSVLPDPDKIRINYTATSVNEDGSDGPSVDAHLTIAALNIEPIDLFYMMSQSSPLANSSNLVNRIGFHIKITASGEQTVALSMNSRTGFTNDQVSLFQLQSLMDQLKEVVQNGKPAKAEDFLLAGGAEKVIESNADKGYDLSHISGRIKDVLEVTMSNGNKGLPGLIDDLNHELNEIFGQLESNTYDPESLPLTDLRQLLIASSMFHVTNAVPEYSIKHSEEAAKVIIEQGLRIVKELDEARKKSVSKINYVASATPGKALALLTEACQDLFGRNFKVFPEFELYNASQYDAAIQYPDYLKHSDSFAIAKWVQGLSPVRQRIRAYQSMGLLSNTLSDKTDPMNLTVAQLPLEPINESNEVTTRWLGLAFPEGYQLPDENVSFVFQKPNNYSANDIQCGIIVDQWVEEIPDAIAHTGIAVHYNNPDSEPAQTCLLAVSPDLSGEWKWDDLMDTLNETLSWAKKRAIDPDLLNETFYAQVLPATFAAVSASDDTPTLDFGRNVIPKPKPGKFDLLRISDYRSEILEDSLLTSVVDLDLTLESF